MLSGKYDKLVWVLLGLVVIALCAFAAGCTTQEQYRAAFLSSRIGAEVGNSNEDRTGKRSWDGDYSALTFSLEPFALGAWMMQAELNARAATEAAYAQRPPPPPVEPDPCAEPK